MTLSDLTRSLHLEQIIEHRRVTRIHAERERRQKAPLRSETFVFLGEGWMEVGAVAGEVKFG